MRDLQNHFAHWTQEDSLLSLEDADRLHVALDQSRGLEFRSLEAN